MADWKIDPVDPRFKISPNYKIIKVEIRDSAEDNNTEDDDTDA